MEERCFVHKDRITVRNSSRDEVPKIIDTAHEPMPWTASDWFLRPLLHVTPTICAVSYRKIKCFMNTKLQKGEPYWTGLVADDRLIRWWQNKRLADETLIDS
jgi:hypothetical protein